MEDRTQEALAEDVRRLDHERWLTCLFAPPPRRRELFALYALNLEIAKTREVVSNMILGQIRLQWWRDALDEMAAGAALRHPVLAPLRSALAERRLDLARLHALVDAREGDLEDEPPATLVELETYAAATGGGLARLHAGLLGAVGAAEVAAEVGTAWALMGLMVALPYRRGAGSHGSGRLWLPADAMRREGLSRGGILPGAPALAAVVRGVADRAAALLSSARSQRRRIPRGGVSALLLARIADERVARLRAAAFDPFAIEPQPSGLLPLRVALAAASGRY